MGTLSFWGGVGTVTGSKYLLETGRARVLVDCGIFQGLKELRERNWQSPPFEPRKLDAVLLTHAHIDHIGYLPRLVKDGFHGPVYCSRATADLARVLLPDSARLQEEEAEYRNRKGLTRHQPALPLYTEQDAERALSLLQPHAAAGMEIEVAPGMRATYHDAGHLLGSRFIVLDLEGAGEDGGDRRIVFSGDIGRYDRPILNDPTPPPATCDYLLIESTYGDRLHDDEDPRVALARVIHDVAERKGPLLIPAFAVGRTQELVYIIRELEEAGKIPVLPVFVDSPMAAKATSAYARRIEEHDPEFVRLYEGDALPLQTTRMRITSSPQESRSINEQQGAHIIISASGMMTGGRVMHHAKRVLPNAKGTILFAGYQAAGTTGRRIQDGEQEVKLMKQWTPVRCHRETIRGFSAHTDWKGALRWLSAIQEPPRELFITHGEPPAASAMREHIREAYGWNVTIPAYGDRADLR
jgi:metallo-beta-lactamase family protein